MSVLYEQNLWGKIDLLHDRYHKQHTHMTHFLEMMSKFQYSCSEFSKNIKNVLNKKYTLADSETSTLFKSMESFTKLLSIHSEVFNEANESIKTNLLEPITKSISQFFQKEKELYNSYCKIRTIYNNSKSSLDKAHKDFENRAKDCENLVYNAKKSKMYSLVSQEQIIKLESKATESIANTALSEDKYLNILNETNKNRENEISSQKNLQIFYQNIDKDFYTKVKNITGFFITSLKKMYTAISIGIDSLADKLNRIKIEKDINDFIEQNKTEAKPDAHIDFIPYKPAPELINNSIINSNKNDSKDLDVSLEVIITFQKIFKKIRTDLNMDEEKKKNRLRILSKKLFNIDNNNNFTKMEKDELLKYLKEQSSRSHFMKFLSKLKKKGFKNNDTLFKDLTEIFLYILELSEKEKDYDSAQNCIVLSQTIYNESNSKVKKYLIDFIHDNKWLNNIEFWEGIIEYMIQREITKNDEINKNKDEKEKKSNMKNIAFSQIFSYTNNMLTFNFKKEDIIALVEKFSQKYEIEKEMVDSIIDNITNILSNKDKKDKIEEEKKENKKNNKKDDKKEDKKDDKDANNNQKKTEIIKDYFSADSEVKDSGNDENK